MTLRPVDMQTLIPRSGEVSRSQHVRETQPRTEQQQAEMQTRMLVDQAMRQVNQTEVMEKSTVNPDGRGPGGGAEGERRRRRAPEQKPDEVKEPGKGNRLDVKL
jgi:hypothetical protein